LASTTEWTVAYSETALKQLRKLDKPSAKRILDFIDERVASQTNPRSTGKALKGPQLHSYWRYRLGDFRIICDIQDQVLRILVIEIGHRKEIYR
jgi:mRNA interferase RelE/StbE